VLRNLHWRGPSRSERSRPSSVSAAMTSSIGTGSRLRSSPTLLKTSRRLGLREATCGRTQPSELRCNMSLSGSPSGHSPQPPASVERLRAVGFRDIDMRLRVGKEVRCTPEDLPPRLGVLRQGVSPRAGVAIERLGVHGGCRTACRFLVVAVGWPERLCALGRGRPQRCVEPRRRRV
jgi:hypothetical protein